METKAKKKTFNIIMVALIAVIAVCGIMLVGHIQGWFGGGGGSDLVCEDITGVVNVERSGVGYSLEKDVAMETGDIVETKNGSEAVLKLGRKNSLSVNEKTEMEIPACEEGQLALDLKEGEFFAEVPSSPDSFTVDFGKNTAKITGTVFSASQQKNSSTLNVYEGSVDVNVEDGSTVTVEAGKQLLIARNSKDKLSVETSDLEATFLSDYLINKLLACDTDVCFSDDSLNKVITAREKEKKAAAKALEQEAIEIASNEQNASSGSGETASGSSDIMTCTIQIQCKTILKNMDKLKPGKNRYVPPNGIILSTSSVQFKKGETAYDVTKRACSATGIQIEASYVPMYGSYYVEGINHLYEFDCGEMSGWLYKVNGWAPNYGCSEYNLKNGDSIVWTYTCTGR